MSLRTEFESSGSWLFRHRSYLPLIMVPIFLGGLASFNYMFESHRVNEAWQWLCMGISLLGVVVRVMTVGFVPAGTSGRNTRTQLAEALNTTGIYSLVRHPLYLGNFLMVLGIVLFFHAWWLVVVLCATYALYYERIMFAEEAFLRGKYGQVFEEWAARTPAFFPSLHRWRSPALPFSWRSVLRREYSSVMQVALWFFILDTAADSIVEKRLVVDPAWLAVLGVGTATYVVLRTLKRHTAVLDAPGR